jgi:hypothetical protein
MKVLRLDPYDIHDRVALNNHLGSVAQHRESYYISCWYLFGTETLDMWEQYAADGVAVCSRYELLHAVLAGLRDETHLGQVQYGTDHLKNTFNAMEFITTKQSHYSSECEARAILTCYDPLASGNRHIDLNNFPHPVPLDLNPRHPWVPDCKRRRIDLRSLISSIVISPWAEADVAEEIELWVKEKGFPASVMPSTLKGPATPPLTEYRALRRAARGEEQDPLSTTARELSAHELDHFEQVLSTLDPDRIRFLYRQRWDSCRLEPGTLPLLAHVQYLERTLRVLRGLEAAQPC